MLQSFFWIYIIYFIYESVWIGVGANIAPSTAIVMCHLPLRKQYDGPRGWKSAHRRSQSTFIRFDWNIYILKFCSMSTLKVSGVRLEVRKLDTLCLLSVLNPASKTRHLSIFHGHDEQLNAGNVNVSSLHYIWQLFYSFFFSSRPFSCTETAKDLFRSRGI